MRRFVGACLATLVVSAQVFTQEQNKPPRYNVRVDLVSIDVEVLDPAGNPIEGLRQGDFRVKEDGVEKEITHFAKMAERPVSLAIVMDTSAMPQEKLVQARQFVFQFIHLLGREDEICLFSFDDRDAYLEQSVTSDRALLVEALQNIDVPSKGQHTVLKDLFGRPPKTGLGIDLALREVKKSTRAKRVVLVISNRFKGLGLQPSNTYKARVLPYTP